ncbi:GNAT family N-acetyltransferase [Streptomyces sp. TLI_146]|uniref:GNAT family N-acetyltransferase n=1 Tax=Streptomyces sp. TLI_146 TaxID=1938858 RepID=UPI000C713753|nr:GNAT family N-acetyltransferase [Streptomyces sp. TLI_146]PKV87785.1 acetyltransferase (GNAT) family protein [Streptomyces sp. TLI_146]
MGTGPDTHIRRVERDDEKAVETAVRLLDEAFQDDPVSSWVFPDPARRREVHRHLMRAFLEISLDEGHVDLAGDGTATALWIDVPAEPEEDGEDGPAQLRAAVDPENERVEQIGRLTGSVHPHGRAHAYLLLIAVAPDRQGQGSGAALIAPVLERCDREGLPAYLEASSERSSRLYERLGFAHLGEPLRLPDGPLMYPMWREPGA